MLKVMNGSESIDRSSEIITEINLTSEEITKRCLDSGIVGMGGAAFPSHVKMTVPEGKKCEYTYYKWS